MLARRIVFAVSLLLNMVLMYTLVWGERGVIAYKELRLRCDALEERIRQAVHFRPFPFVGTHDDISQDSP